jgi:hypothetical protein
VGAGVEAGIDADEQDAEIGRNDVRDGSADRGAQLVGRRSVQLHPNTIPGAAHRHAGHLPEDDAAQRVALVATVLGPPYSASRSGV